MKRIHLCMVALAVMTASAWAANDDESTLKTNLNGKTISEWLKDVGSSDSDRRREAVQMIGSFANSSQRIRDLMTSLLKDNDPLVREHAVRGLLFIPIEHDEAFAAFQAGLKDPESAVRRTALDASRGSFSYRVAPGARAALRDPDLAVRVEAASLLLHVDRAHAKEVVLTLREGIEKGDATIQEKALSAVALTGQTGRPAIPSLHRIIRNGDVKLRPIAAIGLAHIDPAVCEEAIPILVGALNESRLQVIGPHPCAVALRRIALVNKNAIRALVDAMNRPDLRHHAVHALCYTGPPARDAVPALRRGMTDKDEDHRLWAARTLVRIDAALLDEAMPIIVAALKSDREDIRMSAVEIVQEIGPAAREAIPILLDALKKEEAGSLSVVAGALGQVGAGSRAVTLALEGMLKSNDLGKIVLAIQALEMMSEFPKGLEVSSRSLLEAIGEDVKLFSELFIPILVQVNPKPDAALIAVIRAAIQPGIVSDERRVFDAVSQLGPQVRELAPDLLRVCRETGKGAELRRFLALKALMSVAPNEARKLVPELIDGMKDPDPDRRLCAANCLVEIAAIAPEAIDALFALPDDPQSRLVLVQALGRANPVGEKITSTLVRLLRETEVQETRRLPDGAPAPTKGDVLQILQDPEAMGYQECVAGFCSAPLLVDLQPLLVTAAKGRRLVLLEELCRALGRAEAAGKDSLPTLELLRRNPNPTVRLAGMVAEARIDPARGKELLAGLREALKSPEFPVRAAAANALADLGPMAREALPELEKLREDTVHHVRTQAQAAIRRVR